MLSLLNGFTHLWGAKDSLVLRLEMELEVLSVALLPCVSWCTQYTQAHKSFVTLHISKGK